MKFYQKSSLKIKILILLLFFFNGVAQQYPSRHITIKDGLPDKSVYSILKDHNGVLWLGTMNGLVSISGKDIKVYKMSDGLPHNSCWQLVEDQYNTIWIGTYGGGLSCYDGKTFKNYIFENGLANNRIRKLYINKDNLYVGTQNGISTVNLKTRQIKSIDDKKNKLQVMDFFEHKEKIYFVTFAHGAYEFFKEKLVCVNVETEGILSILKSNDSLYISRDAIAFGNKALQKTSIDDFIENKNDNRICFSNTDFWSYTTDASNNIFGAAYGVANPTRGLYQLKNNQAENLNNKFGIESNELWSIYYDKFENQLFLGTLDDGLYVIDLNKKFKFTALSNVKDYQWNRTFGKIILTKEGLQINDDPLLKLSSNEFHDYLKNNLTESNAFWSKFKLSLIPKTFKNTEFELTSFKSLNDELFINSNLGLFKVIKYKNKLKIVRFYTFLSTNFYIQNDKTFHIQLPYEDFYEIDNIDNTNHAFSLTKSHKNFKGIIAILKTDSTTYYVSHFGGLFSYKKNTIKSFSENNQFIEKDLKAATSINNHEFAVSNLNGDVFIINDSKKFSIKRIIKNSELIGFSVYALHYYNDKLIIITEKGINVLDLKTNQIQFFDSEQGINYNQYIKSSVSNDFLLLVTEKGTYDIDLRNVSHRPLQNMNLVSFKANDIEIDSIKQEIKLDYKQNKIDIVFQSPFHMYPKKIMYRYKVEGLKNNNWSEWSLKNTIAFQFLPIGNYTIAVQEKDLSSGNLTDYKLLSFKIKTPFWLTYYFYAFTVLSLFSITYLIIRSRIKKMNQRETEKSLIEKRIIETKLEALQSQMNPHFVFNSMNAIHHYIISNDIDSSLNYINDFTKLMRTTLNNSSRTLVSLTSELSFIKLYIKIQNNRFNNSVKFDSNIVLKKEKYFYSIPPLLLQPIFENCFEHAFNHNSKDNTIDLHISENDSFLIIDIIDNGKGFDITKVKSESKGIFLIKERIQLLHPENNLVIDSVPSHKTKISLFLHKSCLNSDFK